MVSRQKSFLLETLFVFVEIRLKPNPKYMKRVLHLISVKNITFKSSYNWFKIHILRQLRPLTAYYLAMFIVTSTTRYIM